MTHALDESYMENYFCEPTRDQKLSAISMKMARTGGGTGVGETGYFLPVRFEDFREYTNRKGIDRGSDLFFSNWVTRGGALDSQSDECVDYVYSLLPENPL